MKNPFDFRLTAEGFTNLGNSYDVFPYYPLDVITTRRDWARLSSRWTDRIDERIAELERLRAGLTECIGCGCLSLDRCLLANPDDRARALGPGPRYWIGDRPASR